MKFRKFSQYFPLQEMLWSWKMNINNRKSTTTQQNQQQLNQQHALQKQMMVTILQT